MGYTPALGYLGGGYTLKPNGERGRGDPRLEKKDRHPPPRVGRYTSHLGGIPYHGPARLPGVYNLSLILTEQGIGS